VIGTTLVTPFSIAFWWIEPLANHQETAALAVYLGALLWVWLTRPRPLPGPVADVPSLLSGSSAVRVLASGER
jgi:hypothetical protein